MLAVQRVALARSLDLVWPVASGKATLPIAGCVDLCSADGRLELTTNNATTAARCSMDGNLEGRGLVPCGLLREVIQSMAGETVSLAIADNHLEVQSDRQVARLLLNPDDPLPFTEVDPAVSLPTEVLKGVIKSVSVACSHDDTRPVLNGVKLTVEGGRATFAATDGFRLAVAFLDGAEGDLECLIPREVLPMVQTLAGQGKVMQVGRTPATLAFKTEKMEITTCVLNGAFPDYRPIVPEKWATTAVIDRKALAQAVKALRVMEKEAPIRLVFDGQLSLSVSGQDSGKAEVDCKLSGEPVKVAFNPGYLLDCLNSVPAETVSVSLNSSTTPVLFTGGDGYKHVVMPVLTSC